MVSQSWDGKRLYFTSSLLANWDKTGADNEQFLKAFSWDGKELSPRFEIDFTAGEARAAAYDGLRRRQPLRELSRAEAGIMTHRPSLAAAVLACLAVLAPAWAHDGHKKAAADAGRRPDAGQPLGDLCLSAA